MMGLLKRLSANRKVQVVGVFFIIALFLLFMKDFSHPFTFSANLGIEFAGGVRIPISLEQPVDSATMSNIVDVIKTRINKFGLNQAVVRPLGNQQVIVEIPKSDSSVINNIELLLRQQGKFEAILDGKVALSGNDIIPNAVGGAGGEAVNPNNDGTYGYQLVFAITGDGQERFADIAAGKKGFPIYMFLDRPSNAAIIIPRSYVNNSIGSSSKVLAEALRKEGDDLLLIYSDEFEQKKSLLQNRSKVIVGVDLNTTSPHISLELRGMGFITAEEQLANSSNATITKQLVVKGLSEMIPQIVTNTKSVPPSTVVSSWKAIGLTSSPTLDVVPVKQNAITSYSITGSSAGATPQEQKLNAINELKSIKTVISGGRLPVNAVIGSSYDVAPSLGRQFLYYSFIGILVAILLVAVIITVRYRKIALVLPIVITNIVEITLLMAFLGTFGTLDLSAMAGVIALIGTGVDNQIIITDEMLKKKTGEQVIEHQSAKSRLGRAFTVVFTTAAVSIVSMLPLMLSGIVEVMGFALATIMGVVIGVLVTRPAYGALVEEMFGRKLEE